MRQTNIAAAALILLAGPLRSQAPLTPEDFQVAGLHSYMDSQTVRRVLGRPDSIRLVDNQFDSGAKLSVWFYKDVIVDFAHDSLGNIKLVGPTYATRRTLRVGDDSARARKLYGTPDAYHNEWLYRDPANNQHILVIILKAGRVVMIYLGWVND